MRDSRHIAGWPFFLALAGLAAGLVPLAKWALPALAYLRPAILDGELWRLVTGHVVHLTGRHLLWNLAGLAVVWLAVGPRLRPAAWAWVALASALGASLGLLAFAPAVEAMVGLSAVLHGLLGAGALAELRSGRRAGGALLLALLAGKLAWEQLAGPLPGTAAALGDRIALDAHLWGTAGGLAAGAALLLSRPRPRPTGAPRAAGTTRRAARTPPPRRRW